MEPESDAARRKRRNKRIRYTLTELVIVAGFVAAIFLSRALAQEEAPLALKLVAVALPIGVLTGWWYFYYRHIRSLGEFEQVIATRSLAIAFGITLWIATAWGLLSVLVGAPALPAMMIAPLAAIVYSVTQGIFMLLYR